MYIHNYVSMPDLAMNENIAVTVQIHGSTNLNLATGQLKGALYRIHILCRRYTFWSYPAGLTIADPPG